MTYGIEFASSELTNMGFSRGGALTISGVCGEGVGNGMGSSAFRISSGSDKFWDFSLDFIM